MKGLRFGVSGTLDKAVNTTKINNPKKNNTEAISDTPMNHWSPTVAGITMLKKSI
jgi:hypothetical protein